MKNTPKLQPSINAVCACRMLSESANSLKCIVLKTSFRSGGFATNGALSLTANLVIARDHITSFFLMLSVSVARSTTGPVGSRGVEQVLVFTAITHRRQRACHCSLPSRDFHLGAIQVSSKN